MIMFRNGEECKAYYFELAAELNFPNAAAAVMLMVWSLMMWGSEHKANFQVKESLVAHIESAV